MIDLILLTDHLFPSIDSLPNYIRNDEQLSASPSSSPHPPTTPPHQQSLSLLFQHPHPLCIKTRNTHPRPLYNPTTLQGPIQRYYSSCQTTLGISIMGIRIGEITTNFGKITKYENGRGERSRYETIFKIDEEEFD